MATLPQRVVPLVIALLLVGLVAGTVLFDVPERLGLAPASGTTSEHVELQVLVQKHMEPLLDNPAFQQRVQGLGAVEAQRVGMEMSARGLARLDGPSLVTRARLMGGALDAADTRVCAALTRGNAAPQEVERALLGLGPERLEVWARLSADAMLAELEEAPYEPLSREQARDVITTLAAVLPGDDGERLQGILARVQSANDADLCWMGRTLYHGVAQLPGAEGEVLARALVTP